MSCAEHYWPDIKTLISERYRIANLEEPNWEDDKLRCRHVNEMTVVIQEYFQVRVQHWLKSIGAPIFGIKHWYLRYEFAPGRGQIHAHMLCISDKAMHIATKAKNLTLPDRSHNENMEADHLFTNLHESFGYTCKLPTGIPARIVPKAEHPANKIAPTTIEELKKDLRDFMCTTQNHVCTDHCLKKRKVL